MSMTNDDYQMTQEQLIAIAGLLNIIDLAGFLDRISDAETIVPIVDPTLWIKGNKKLEQVKCLAQAAQYFQDEIRRQIAAGWM